jgi:hypothetical protein
MSCLKNICVLFGVIFLIGCKAVVVPDDFLYKEIKISTFVLASWQKITNPSSGFKIYIEGDGASFDAYGLPTNNPTPKGKLLREIAFADKSPNVIYLSRPCQFVMSDICSQRHWTTARFAPEIVLAMYDAISEISGDNDVVLIGFSGGAQIAGLVSVVKKGINVKKIITIGGNLDHLAWTEYHGLPPLTESLNLESYRSEFIKIPQKHYVGTKDKIIPMELVYEFVKDNSLIEQVNAYHNDGWDVIYEEIWAE